MVTPARPSADAGRGSGRGGRQRGNYANASNTSANRGALSGARGGDGSRPLCNHYSKGSCTFGSDCHFRHDASAATASTTSATARGRGGRGKNDHVAQQTDGEANPPRFRGDYLSLHRRMQDPIINQQAMRALVRALGGVDANEAVAALASEDGGKRLDELTSCPFVAQPRTENAYSFVGVIVPLLMIVVDNKFRQTAYATSLQKVWPRLSNAEFITRAVECACTDGLQPTSSWAREDREFWERCGQARGVAGLVAQFIFTLLRYERDVQADIQFEEWVKRIERRAPGSPWVVHLRAIVDEANKKSLEKCAAAAAATALRAKSLRASQASSPPGGRHDNDHRDFRATRIEPTQEEILTHARPYLPRVDEEMPHATSDVGALLERHARLMREDMVVPLRRGVRAFLDVAVAPFKKASGSQRVKVNACKDDELFGGRGGGQHEMGITALRHARFERIVTDKRKGPIVMISFDQMTSLSAKGKRERVDFWREHGLTPDSLVCIAANVRFNSEDGPPGLVFATVCAPIPPHDDSKWEALYGGDRCFIHVTPLDLKRDVSRLIALSEPTARGAENFVLQIQGHFYAGYKYVLSVLQSPLTDTYPILHTLASADTGMHTPQTNPLSNPEFFSRGTCVGISALLKDNAPAGTAQHVTIDSYDGVREQLRAILPVIRIDGTQVDAVAAILTRKIALIQGPPGTGKTHVGAIATKMILDHSIQMRAGLGMHRGAANGAIAIVPTPILCICYTNHALDQYLEALHMKEGVPLENIVRIGGRSRSELLARRNLFTLERESLSNTTHGERARYAKLSREMDSLAKEIEEHEEMATLQLETASWNCVSEVFSVLDPVNHARVSSQDGDFVSVGDVNKRWKKWVQGWVPKTTAAHAERQRKVSRERVNQFSAIGESADNGGDAASSDGDAAVTEDHFGQLWIVPVAERRRTAMACIETIRLGAIKQLTQALSAYQEKSNEIAELKNVSAIRLLSKATVIGMTTSGCAKHASILQALEPPVVLCEEAGEVLESHVIASLSYGTKQLILIGDHKQLRPKVEYELSVESKRGYDLDVSLFERLVRIGEQGTTASKDNDGGCSDGDAEESVVGAETQARGAWHVTLDSQYRMRPEIAHLIRSTIYPTLCNGDNVASYPNARGFGRNLLFFDHDTPESKGGGAGLRSPKSYTNEFEAEMVVQLIRYAVKQGYKPDDIAVLATYTGQLLVLREKLTRERMMVRLSDGDAEELGLALFDGEESTTNTDMDSTRSAGAKGRGSVGKGKQDNANRKAGLNKEDDGGPTAVSLRECVRLSTVDNFQGEEALLVFVSTVRCNDKGQIGFLKTSNRVNVMLSRAKHAMYVLGSSRTVDKRQGESMFKSVLQLLRDGNAVVRSIPLRCDNHQTITEVSTPTQIRSFCKDGGCTLSCNARMKCGHKCALTCHPDNRDHDPAGVCNETCMRLLRPCQHPCPKLCGEKCPTKCNKIEKRTLLCGHTKDAKCHEVVATLKCDVSVDVMFPSCGHAGKVKCCLRSEFEELCKAIADGSKAAVHLDEANKAHIFDCCTPCGQGRDPCAHMCKSMCGACTRATALALAEDSGDVRISRLHARTSHAGLCKEHCTRTMSLCGHPCGGGSCHTASECPPCPKNCRIACAHSRCTEQCSVACAPCAEAECVWACTSDHPGGGRLACLHPCAVPCERLPCDHRCSKTLLCGHTCPCVCGDRCADEKHCPECARNNGGDNGNCVVELIMSTTLADHTVNDPPLVILACNHAFTTEHLDMQLGMDMFYRRDPSDGKWISTKDISAITDNELDDLAKRATCPLCRVPISGVLRYGRPLKAIEMRRAGILFLRKAQVAAAAYEQEAQCVRAQVDDDSTHMTGDSDGIKKALKTALSMHKTLQQCINDAEASIRNSPPKRVYELEVIASQRVGAAPSLRDAPLWQPVCRLYMAALRCATASLAISGVVVRRMSIAARDPVAQSPGRTAGKKQPGATGLTAATNAVKKAYEMLVDVSNNHSRASRESGARVECERGLLVAVEGHLVMAEIASQVAALEDEYMRRALAAAKSALADVGNASLLQAREELNGMLKRIEKAKKSLTIEEKRAVFAAMSGMGGYGVGSFGGHWKSCPNGHVYYVDACGGAMQQSKCPDCDAVIGGHNHTLAEGNGIATQFLADVGGELPPPNWEANANVIAHGIHGFF